MSRKLGVAVCALCVALSLSGCSNEIPDMTKEQSAMVAEYAAGLLLKYDKNHKNRLVEEGEEEENSQPVEEVQDEEFTPNEAVNEEEKQDLLNETVSENQTPDVSSESADVNMEVNIGNFLELGNIQVDYIGYEVMDSYAEGNETDLAFAMDASKGAKLLVTKFQLSNQSAEDVTCDVLSKNVHFRIDYGLESKNALVTMLSDDLATLNTTIPAGENITAVLIIEVKAEEAEAMEDLSLEIKYNGNSINTLLKH